MIVLCNGCFDPLHVGHLYHFMRAREHGTRLYVSVTHDGFVNKGKGRPAFPVAERVAIVNALRIVDGAFACRSAMEALKRLRPDVYAKGAEYEGNLPEQAWCEKHGIKVVFTNGKVYSSTKLLHYYARQG